MFTPLTGFSDMKRFMSEKPVKGVNIKALIEEGRS